MELFAHLFGSPESLDGAAGLYKLGPHIILHLFKYLSNILTVPSLISQPLSFNLIYFVNSQVNLIYLAVNVFVQLLLFSIEFDLIKLLLRRTLLCIHQMIKSTSFQRSLFQFLKLVDLVFKLILVLSVCLDRNVFVARLEIGYCFFRHLSFFDYLVRCNQILNRLLFNNESFHRRLGKEFHIFVIQASIVFQTCKCN